jgi:hypothetical protein
MSDWYYGEAGQQKGPVSEAQLAALLESGALAPSTLVWTDGMTEWQAAATIAGLVPPVKAAPPAVVAPAVRQAPPAPAEPSPAVTAVTPPAGTAPAGAASVSVKCSGCKRKFDQTNLQALVSPVATLKLMCPKCMKSAAVAVRELGCPRCRQSVWVSPLIMGNAVQCPHCHAALPLPTEAEWKEQEKQAAAFRWTVQASASGTPVTFENLESLTAAITKGEVAQSDACTTHAFAPRKELREVCDPHFALRNLYDPVGAWVARVGGATGATFVVLYLLACLIRGLATMGASFLLYVLLGAAAVLLTPTIIGLFIVYLIARACEAPLLWAYLGVLLGGLVGYGLFLLGNGIGRVTMYIIAKLTGMERKRTVIWERKPAANKAA